MIDLILRRAEAAGIALSNRQAEQFAVYHRMLVEANAHFNLTRVPDTVEEAVDRNYLDCLAPLAKGFGDDVHSIVDVGSGAGFPGIPLAIGCPDKRLVLMDSLSKRVEFLNSVIAELGLNAQAVHIRAEDAARRPEYREMFDVATARAVASLNLLSEYLLPFVREGGYMLAYKGPSLDEELAAAQHAFDELGGCFERQEQFNIPGRDWDHRLAWIRKCAPTPEKYPRKAGKPEKKPL